MTTARIMGLLLWALLAVSCSSAGDEAERERQRAKAARIQLEAERGTAPKVALPAGATQEIDPTQDSIVVVVPPAGDVAINGEPVRDADLDRLFRAAVARDPATQVVLQAGKGVSHGRVVEIMELARRAGLTRVAIGAAAGQ